MRKLIDNKDYNGIKQILADNPDLANEGIAYDEMNSTKAHPLHRICDGVFSKRYTDEEAVLMAKIFLENGAKVDGSSLAEKQDTPLIAAASLHADEVAILYIENGASINHAGCHGGTALHWAAWCGRDNVVRKLLKNGAEINRQCIDFEATPLFWAIHGLKKGDKNNIHNQLECARILIQSGADKDIPNKEGKRVFDLLNKEDLEIVELLNR
ncbi:MAG: ankyrin repeat domain-containing protein [Chitinophagaceae bacterium]